MEPQAMMGQQAGNQSKIFYYNMNLDKRIPQTHLLRKIQEQIDFNFIYAEVKDTYGVYVFRPFWTNMLKASLHFGVGLRHC